MKHVLSTLIKKNEKIAFVESMTGGTLASSFIKIKNASKAIDVSYITYSNEQKIKVLGIKKELIENYGVVSKEVAYEMVKKLHTLSNADLCVSTTGYANGKHQLVCFVGIYYKNDINTYEIPLESSKSRIKNINYTVKKIIDLIEETIA